MEEKIKELKEKFEGSNKYKLTLSYEDIKKEISDANSKKSKTESFISKVSTWYTLAVIVLSVIVFISIFIKVTKNRQFSV